MQLYPTYYPTKHTHFDIPLQGSNEVLLCINNSVSLKLFSRKYLILLWNWWTRWFSPKELIDFLKTVAARFNPVKRIIEVIDELRILQHILDFLFHGFFFVIFAYFITPLKHCPPHGFIPVWLLRSFYHRRSSRFFLERRFSKQFEQSHLQFFPALLWDQCFVHRLAILVQIISRIRRIVCECPLEQWYLLHLASAMMLRRCFHREVCADCV